MKRYYILIILFSLEVNALVVCSPLSCSPPCDGSCTYQACDKGASVTHDIKVLPFLTPEPSDACAFSPVNITQAPFNLSGETYIRVPVSPLHKYTICNTYTNYGGACPPPPPPP